MRKEKGFEAEKLGVNFMIMHEAPTYGIKYKSPEFERIRNNAIKLIEKGKSLSYVSRKVREEMFAHLITTNPKRALQIEIKYYQSKGKKVQPSVRKAVLEIAEKKGYARASAYLKDRMASIATAQARRKATESMKSAVKLGNALRRKFGIDSKDISINGEKMSVSDAIRRAGFIKNRREREKYVKQIIDETLELWRIRGKNENTAVNAFGLKYGMMSSDPSITSIAENKAINCFSGAITASAIASSIMKDTGVNGSSKIVEVVAWGSVEVPHSSALISIGGKEYVYDMTNISIKSPLEVTKPTMAIKILLGEKIRGSEYYLGDRMSFDDAKRAAKIQEQLFKGKEMSIAQFMELPPAYQKYVIDMKRDDPNYIKFAEKLDLNKIDAIVSAHIAVILCDYYFSNEGDFNKSYKYARILAKSIVKVIKEKRINSMKISGYYSQYRTAFDRFIENEDYRNALNIYLMVRGGIYGRRISAETSEKYIESAEDIASMILTINEHIEINNKLDAPLDAIAIADIGVTARLATPRDTQLNEALRHYREELRKIFNDRLIKMNIDPKKYEAYFKSRYGAEQREFLRAMFKYFKGIRKKMPKLYARLKLNKSKSETQKS